MMHMQSNIRTCRHEWLPLAVLWESPRSPALNASVVVPAKDLTAEFLPFWTLLASSCVECVMPSPIFALSLLFSQPVLVLSLLLGKPILDGFDEL